MKLVAAKCPSCGANINVDRSLKFTKCEYCNTEIIVQEAVENLLKVELKDSPTLDNYIKIGNRYFDNYEYEEAYKAYSKAEEIDPDNPFVVLRRGLCRSLASDYNHLDIHSAVKAMETSYDLMKKMKMSKEEIDKSINDTGTTLFLTYQYIVDVYKKSEFNKEQSKGYVEKLEDCLKGYQYLDKIIDNNQDLTDRVLNSMIMIIDTILGKTDSSNYKLSSSYVKELNNIRKDCMARRTKVMSKPSLSKGEKVVGVQKKESIIGNILCYCMVIFLFFWVIGAMFSEENILLTIISLLALISFIPQVKRLLVKKFGGNTGELVVAARIILIILAFVILASLPVEFENTYISDDGTIISLENGNISIISGDNKISGTYTWDSKDNDYYIHAQGDALNGKLEYHYHSNEDGGSLCLLENNKCTTIYLPKKPNLEIS